MTSNPDWLDEIDRELSRLREAEARLYYDADCGAALDAKALSEIARQRHAILTDPSLTREADALARDDAPATRRKAQLLTLNALAARLDDDETLAALRLELDRTQRSMGREMRTTDGLRRYLGATEKCARESIRIANAIARREGFEGYPSAKLACQELSPGGLMRTLADAHVAFASECRSAIAGIDAGAMTEGQLDRAVTAAQTPDGDGFPTDGKVAAVRTTLALAGFDFDRLPIKTEERELPYPGAVHTLKIGADMRIVIDGNKGGFTSYALLFHEVGHAVYYAYCPDSTLLLDNRIGREGLAEMWARLVETQEWLRTIARLNEGAICELLDRQRRFHGYMMMTFVRDALFELAVYREPDADFAAIWRRVTADCLGVDDTTGTYTQFIFLYPMDIKDYVYAHLIGESVLADLAGRFEGSVLRDGVVEFLGERYYRQGNAAPWHERIPAFSRARQ